MLGSQIKDSMTGKEEFEVDVTVDSGIKPQISAAVHCPSCGLHVTGGFSSCPNDGTRLMPDPTADAVLQDRYDSLELIGEGGMSAIYKARHKLMKRTVAIKLLHSRFRNNVDTMRRFQKEAEAISSLSHENVVNVFDFGQLQHGQAYMVMNYVSGQSMADLIKRENPLELQRALQLLLQISSGLDHAHRKHIVHRDLKPTNVMITADESGKEKAIIVDFGIAKFLADEEGATQGQPLTKTGDVIGSPYYMSPEQCLGRQIDVRSDIYSFGCLIYESLVGKPVFMGNNSLETMHKHIKERPPTLDQMNGNPALKPHMQAIIHKALEKEPDKRYQTIADLDHDLKIMDAALKKG
ncbi:MAG: serine/threonine protein kinase, partial [Candidatus Obscuribacterales bacterium]|nr:serine/threonine protein kinase [Candidatus Obscuribacterales bacterium]